MFNISYKNKEYQCRSDETLLQAFLRQGIELSFSCQKGSCQVCMMHCESGHVNGLPQRGLRREYSERGYFLPCQTQPVSDMVIHDIDTAQLYSSALVSSKEILGGQVCRLLLEVDNPERFRGGQFVNIHRPSDGLTRSYSIASHPVDDYFLELHIKRMENGAMSQWIFDELQEQELLEIQGPLGQCCYQAGDVQTPIILFAGGTGAAPLFGVIKEALAKGHSGTMVIYHEVQNVEELYVDEELKTLVQQHEQLEYRPCISSDTDSSTDGVFVGTALEAVQSQPHDLTDSLVYVAGPAGMVQRVYENMVNAGVNESRLFADPFDMKDLRHQPRSTKNAVTESISSMADAPLNEVDYPPADPEMWLALEQGKKLYKILSDFYDIVYEDERLSPFFERVTKQRSIEKVYLFLRQIFSGEKVYFGDRPRNAHHWMVISDELFDYREDIMERCLRDNGLPEHLIQRWRQAEEIFRPDIVKDKPWNRMMNGVEISAEGFEEMILDSGSICDSCQQPVEVGTRVRYHVRLGSIYCPKCMNEQESEQPVKQAQGS